MNYYSRTAQFSYRVTFIAAAVTYGIVVYKTWRARQKTGAKQSGGALGYLADENIQYLGTCSLPVFPAGPAFELTRNDQQWRLSGSLCRNTPSP